MRCLMKKLMKILTSNQSTNLQLPVQEERQELALDAAARGPALAASPLRSLNALNEEINN